MDLIAFQNPNKEKELYIVISHNKMNYEKLYKIVITYVFVQKQIQNFNRIDNHNAILISNYEELILQHNIFDQKKEVPELL